MKFINTIRRYWARIFNFVLNIVLRRFHTMVCEQTLRMVFQKEIEEWRPDVVHAHDGIALPVAAEVAKNCDAKLVFDSHELETHRNPPLPWLQKLQVTRLERRYLPRADTVFTVGRKIAEYLRSRYAIASPVILYNSPPTRRSSTSDRWDTATRESLREEVMAPEGSFLLVHTGNVTHNRGIEHAVIGLSKAASLPDLRKRYPKGVHLALVGNCVPSIKSRIDSLHRRYHNAINIHYVDPVSPNRVTHFIRSADASISPAIPIVLSYEFAMPNKLFEAILSGLPIISSDLVEAKELIEKYALGVTYQADDTNKLAEAFAELAINIHQYRRSSDRQAELEELFSWEAQERKLIDIYQGLCSSK